MKWYKRDPAAALEGMAGLTIEERGFYNTIIDAYFARDGHLPDDDWLLSRICKCDPRTVRRLKISLFQKQKLRVDGDGTLVPNRGKETLLEGKVYSELQRRRARMRWDRREIASKINGPSMPSVAMPLHPHTNLNSSFLPSAAREKINSNNIPNNISGTAEAAPKWQPRKEMKASKPVFEPGPVDQAQYWIIKAGNVP